MTDKELDLHRKLHSALGVQGDIELEPVYDPAVPVALKLRGGRFLFRFQVAGESHDVNVIFHDLTRTWVANIKDPETGEIIVHLADLRLFDCAYRAIITYVEQFPGR